MKGKLNSNNLIAVSGVKGSGKDVSSKMLQYCLSVPKMFRQYWLYNLIGNITPKKYKILSFADPVKKMLAILLNVPEYRFRDRDFKERWIVDIPTLELSVDVFNKAPSDSKFNKLVKQLDPSLVQSKLRIRQLMQYWATEIMQTYFTRKVWINCTLHNSSRYTIISDLRFKEEYKAIKEQNGIVIYINRPNYQFGEHASEKEMKELLENNKYDYVINNSGSMKDLFNSIKNITNDI